MAEPRKLDDNLTVNDGKGLFDNEGLIDSLIADCNEIPRALMNGQNIRFCGMIFQMTQKLVNLKTGIKNDTDSLLAKIAELHRLNDELSGKGKC